ncbi:MAG TPA: aldo/keto reductase [Chloroflexia bacterium]|nr:aldo/keto reductase [Chloroflexia bacterium]
METIPEVKLGKTGLTVPRLGLGSAFLAGPFVSVPERQALEAVEYALEEGIRFFDTAPLYGAGQAEIRLGRILSQVPRDSFVLSTKVGRLVKDDGTVVFDYSRDGILRSFEESLKRLQLDRVDILLLHDPDDFYREALENGYPVLDELRSQGVISAVGAGMNQWEMLADFARQADFDCFLLAGRYTLLEQKALDEFLPLCQQKGIGVFMGGILNSGILATGAIPGARYNYEPAPPEILERVSRIEAICARYGVPLNVAALQFPAAHPAASALIVGAQSKDEIAANFEFLKQPLPQGLWDDLKREGLLAENAPVPQESFL